MAPHPCPQEPQLLGSLLTFAHVPLQSVVPVGQPPGLAMQAPEVHEPAPPPTVVQAVPSAVAGWAGAPFTQTSSVHGLPSSAGRSELSATLITPPWPSQTFCRQSPAVWAATAVPDGV